MRASAIATSVAGSVPVATASSTPRMAARAASSDWQTSSMSQPAPTAATAERAGGEHAGPPEPARQRDAQAGDPCRVGPEGAVADHVVARVGPDVEHRGEVEVDADRAQLAPHGAADRLGEAGVAPC